MDEFQKVLGALLRGKALKAPFIIGVGENNYREALENKLNEYVRRLNNLNTSGPLNHWVDSNVHNIEELNATILEALDEYLSGNAGRAYDSIERLMGSSFVRSNIAHLKSQLDAIYSSEHKSLFRVRYSDSLLSKREDLFHIPFSGRHLVNTQRYSIAGLPCLYLGASLYVCWQEMGCPDLNKLYLSHFKINPDGSEGTLDILDFAYSFETLKDDKFSTLFKDELSLEKKQSYLAMWPILLSCSFNRKHDNPKFNVEYVIPNLIFQWVGVGKRSVSGIRYLSTKTTHLRNSEVGINYVFPSSIPALTTSDFCDKLSNSFHLSSPVSWQVMSTMADNNAQQKKVIYGTTDNVEDLIVGKYESTQFYSMERKLMNIMKCDAMVQES